MSHLWLRDAEKKPVAHSIRATSFDVRALLLLEGSGSSAGPLESGLAARMVSFRVGNAERWVVVAGPDAQLRVNGIPLSALGMRVLADRDEISIAGGGSAFYSAEDLAEVVAFAGADRVMLCGRCRQKIESGSPAVKCPGCGTWYHEHSNLQCFTYHPTCAFCPKPTALDAGFSWVPED